MLFTLPNVGLTPPPGTYNPNARGRDACRESTDCGPEHWTDTEGRASLNVWSAQCEGHRQRQGHTPSPRIKMKISDLTGNRTRTTELEGRDSTGPATGD